MIGSLISEYPGYSLISDRDSACDCFLNDLVFFFLKACFSLVHWLGICWRYYSPQCRWKPRIFTLPHYPPLRWIITRCLLLSIHAWRRARFFQIQGIFHYFRAFKTEILHIYSLTGQIPKQSSPSVSVPSVRFLTSPLRCSVNIHASHLHFGE